MDTKMFDGLDLFHQEFKQLTERVERLESSNAALNEMVVKLLMLQIQFFLQTYPEKEAFDKVEELFQWLESFQEKSLPSLPADYLQTLKKIFDEFFPETLA